MKLKIIEFDFCREKNEFLTPELGRFLCNALIQPHFDYASSA